MNPIDIVLLLAVFILVWRVLNIISAAREARKSQRMAGEMREMYEGDAKPAESNPSTDRSFGASMRAYPPLSPRVGNAVLVTGELAWDDVRNCWSNRTGITTELQGLPRRAPPPKNCQNCGAPATAPVCGHCGTHH